MLSSKVSHLEFCNDTILGNLYITTPWEIRCCYRHVRVRKEGKNQVRTWSTFELVRTISRSFSVQERILHFSTSQANIQFVECKMKIPNVYIPIGKCMQDHSNNNPKIQPFVEKVLLLLPKKTNSHTFGLQMIFVACKLVNVIRYSENIVMSWSFWSYYHVFRQTTL